MRVIFMGTPDFAVPCLKALIQEYNVVAVVTQPDKAQGRGRKVKSPPIKMVANQHSIPVLQPANVNSDDCINELKKFNADVVIVVAYGQILKKSILHMTEIGAINVHASLLPKLRGGAPIHRSIMQGDTVTGVTTMLIEPKLDSGPILLTRQIEIDQQETVGSLHDKLAEAGADLLIDTLKSINDLTPQVQDHNKATYASIIQREDRVIDWSKSAEEIYNQVRGLNPWPVAFTFYKEKPLQVWGCKIYNSSSGQTAKLGQIVKFSSDGPVIKCGDGCLLISELKPAGKRKMSGSDFCRGYHCSTSDILG